MENKSILHRLGDYIRQVDVRNRDLAIAKLLGLSIAKEFIPSIANIIGTDMSNYKIVKPRQFGYVPVTSRNGDKITIALYGGKVNCIISQAYIVFEVKDENKLLPEYLMMWFRRPEFDRYARFKSHGSAREVFEWDEMCNVMLPVPPIEEQRKIVAQYQAIEQRIENNRRLIATLESAAQTIYRNMFVDNIDPNNLPDGWRKAPLSQVSDIQYGFPFDSKYFNNQKHGLPVIRIRDIERNYSETYTTQIVDERYIIQPNDLVIGMDGNFIISSWKGKEAYQNQRTAIVRPKQEELISPMHIQLVLSPILKSLETSIEGTTVAHLNAKHFQSFELILPPKDILSNFYKIAQTISSSTLLYSKEILSLQRLLRLLIAN